jgi:short subunit dehydrogenase-like uncharacterized protein
VSAEEDTMAERTARPFDVVLLGATGFTGGLTATELAQRAGPACRWTIAGRDRSRLEGVRRRLAGVREDLADLPVVVADVHDSAAMRELASSTRVLATTVGPYLRHGEAPVAACAAEGTDYVDLTGEPEFVDRSWLRHHTTAEASGARLVHACGFDSVPHDLGARFTVEQLPEGVPLEVHAFVRVDAGFSGGTAASALGLLGRLREARHAAHERRRIEGPPPRSVHVGRGPWREQGDWALPLPTLDPVIVARSAAASPRYGPEFRYSHSLVVGALPLAVGALVGAAALTVVAQVAPARDVLERRLSSGSGPSEERRARSRFEVRFHGSGGGQRVVTRVAGGDPGYTETSKMLAEAALCLAFDDLPDVAGQTTTAVAMGEALTRRLVDRGLTFEVEERSSDR